MKRMRNFLKMAIISLILLLCFLLFILQKKHDYPELLQKYTDKGLPGLIILVQNHEQKIVEVCGYSNLEQKKKLSKTDIFYSASVGKVYCATAILILEQENKLSISDKIKKYLPDSVWKNLPNGNEITIQQLLNHTSGLANFDYDRNFYNQVISDPYKLKRSDIISIILKQKKNLPGRFNYSSSNYELLTLIMDSVTGNHSKLYTDKIFKVLDLNNTYYKNEKWYPNPPNLVDCYTEGINHQLIEISSANNHITSVLTGSDGVMASVYDYCKFLRSLLNGKVLNVKTLDKMQNWIPVDSIRSYGLGLIRLKTKYGYCIGHDGDAWGEALDIWYFPKYDISVVLATNVGTGTPNSQIAKLYNTSLINDLLDLIFSKSEFSEKNFFTYHFSETNNKY